jgi:hypothetical protein
VSTFSAEVSMQSAAGSVNGPSPFDAVRESSVRLSPQEDDQDHFWPWVPQQITPAERDSSPSQEDPNTFWPWLQTAATGSVSERAAPCCLDDLYAKSMGADGRVATAGEDASWAAAEALTASPGQMLRERLAVDAVFAALKKGRLSSLTGGEKPVRCPLPAEAPLPADPATPSARLGPTLGGLALGAWHALIAPLRRQERRRKKRS